MYIKGAFEITIYINYKNLLMFTTTKILNKRQIRWFKLLKQYKITIKQIAKKNNGRINILNKYVDYINRKLRKQMVLKINNNKLLFSIPQNFEAILMIL